MIGRSLRGGEVLALYGELGVGKTALVRGIAAGLGAPPRLVSSPTFVLIHEYRGRLALAHADLYRVESPAEIRDLGLSDYLDGRAVVAIEWAEKAGPELPDERLEVRISYRRRSTRMITLKATGVCSLDLLTRTRKLDQPQPGVPHHQSSVNR
jgi:tRNA threonylcarbamoyladenosine biosynthesis protein TsaE